MREKDLHREFNDCKELLGETKFTGEPGRKPSRRKSQLDRIEALLKKILELLNRREAVTLNTTLGPPVPEGKPLPTTKGAIRMNLVTSQTAGNKCLVSLHPADSNNDPAPIDQTDHPVTVTSTDDAVVSVSDLATDGLSFQLHFLKAGTASVNIDADADLDAGELRDLIDTIDVTVVAASRPEAATLGIVIGPSVAEGDPLP
jgi:hypothetical protein